MREVPFSTTTHDTLAERRNPLPLDSPFVQQTKDRIRAIVGQITKMSQSAIEPSDFWEFALPRILDAMGGEAAAVWAWRPDHGWILVHQTRMPVRLLEGDNVGIDSEYSSFETMDGIEEQISVALRSVADASDTPKTISKHIVPSETHLQLLEEVRKEDQPILIPPLSASSVKGRPANPTEFLLMLVPFPIALDGGQLWLELLQKPSGGPSSQRGYLRFAAQMADILADYLQSFRLRTLERDQEFMRRSYETIDMAASAPDRDCGLSKLISDIRNAADAEHAILFRRNGSRQRWRVTAIAGLTKVDRRADGVYLLEDSAPYLDLQLKHGAALHRDYTQVDQQQETSLPTEMERWKETFAISRLIWIKPLLVDVSNKSGTSTLLDTVLTPRGVSMADNTELRAHDIAILLTWSGQGIPPVRCVEQSALTLKLGLAILRPRWWQSHMMRDTRLYPAPSLVGAGRKWFAAVLLSLLVAAVMAIPVPIQIEATATLRPVKVKEMFASADGVIQEVLVKGGQSVQAGEPLLRIDSPRLLADYDEAKVRLEQLNEEMDELKQSWLNNLDLPKIERDRIELRLEALPKIEQLHANHVLRLEREIEELIVRAPSSCIVETWHDEESREKQPVRMGQWLFSIREQDSEWELEAAIPERYLQELRIACNNASPYVIARMTSLPTQPLRLRVRDPVSWRPMETNTVNSTKLPEDREYRVRFALEDSLPASVALTGASARVAITTGQGPLIWALSKDFIEDISARTAMWLR